MPACTRPIAPRSTSTPFSDDAAPSASIRWPSTPLPDRSYVMHPPLWFRALGRLWPRQPTTFDTQLFQRRRRQHSRLRHSVRLWQRRARIAQDLLWPAPERRNAHQPNVVTGKLDHDFGGGLYVHRHAAIRQLLVRLSRDGAAIRSALPCSDAVPLSLDRSVLSRPAERRRRHHHADERDRPYLQIRNRNVSTRSLPASNSTARPTISSAIRTRSRHRRRPRCSIPIRS